MFLLISLSNGELLEISRSVALDLRNKSCDALVAVFFFKKIDDPTLGHNKVGISDGAGGVPSKLGDNDFATNFVEAEMSEAQLFNSCLSLPPLVLRETFLGEAILLPEVCFIFILLLALLLVLLGVLLTALLVALPVVLLVVLLVALLVVLPVLLGVWPPAIASIKSRWMIKVAVLTKTTAAFQEKTTYSTVDGRGVAPSWLLMLLVATVLPMLLMVVSPWLLMLPAGGVLLLMLLSGFVLLSLLLVNAIRITSELPLTNV